MNRSYNKFLLFCGLTALALGTINGARAAYIFAKAEVAQVFMQQAWKLTLENQLAQKPWSWADMETTAQLSYSLTGKTESHSLIVLDNATGEAMAFGPGLVAGNLHNATESTVAIGGHRDTHLAFLEYANTSTLFSLQTPDGKTLEYQFQDAFIVDTRTQSLQISQSQPGLVLITCYPFNALQTGGPMRLVARAKLMNT